MSKMMDNLARVQEEAEPEKKPSLFIVRDQAPPSALQRPAGFDRKKAAIWGCVAVAVVALGVMIVQSLPIGNSTSPAVAVSAASNDAVSLIRARDFRNAKQKLDELIAAQPGNRAHLINRAYVLKELGNSAAAESEYKALLTRLPGDPAVLNNLGALYLKAGRYGEAEAVLRKAADAGYADARLNLAAVFEKKKDWPGALKVFENMLAADEAGASHVKIKERVRRLRSLAVSSDGKEKF